MAERQAHKYAVMFFLLAVFILLAAVTAAWLYKVYTEQTTFSEKKTLATVECGRYYFSIDENTVAYHNGTLYFEIENTLGAEIKDIIVESSTETKELNMTLAQGMIQPVSLPMEFDAWVLVYPRGCEGINFKNITFEAAREG
jgi:hypothetical protein